MAGLVALSAVKRWLRRATPDPTTAVNNMAQGLCMWSTSGKLVLCNQRYGEMYDLSLGLAKPGSLAREVVEHRIESARSPVMPTSTSPTC